MFQDYTLQSLLMLFGAVLLSMSVHEMMHAFVGHALGDTTAKEQGRLTLNPLKHIDLLTTVLLPVVLVLVGARPFFAAKPVPFNPDRVKYDEWGAAMIAAAGPLTNLVLAVITALIARGGSGSFPAAVIEFLIIFASVNVGFFVFNMIPFPPLDGSRVLYAVAPESVQGFMRVIEQWGFTAILAFMFVLYPIISPVINQISEFILLSLLGVR